MIFSPSDWQISWYISHNQLLNFLIFSHDRSMNSAIFFFHTVGNTESFWNCPHDLLPKLTGFLFFHPPWMNFPFFFPPHRITGHIKQFEKGYQTHKIMKKHCEISLESTLILTKNIKKFIIMNILIY